jgi:hypothetical protein
MEADRTAISRAVLLALMLLLLPRAPAAAQGTAEQIAPRIYLPPPLQWDIAMFTPKPALQQMASDFGLLTGGIVFGMTPGAANARLPNPLPSQTWNTLQSANEYPGEVRYFWLRLNDLPGWLGPATGCIGDASYVVFLFSPRGLFRLSFRLLPDPSCSDTTDAALRLFARYVTIGPTVALSVHYRTRDAQVVDVTDPSASFLIPTRWQMSGN